MDLLLLHAVGLQGEESPGEQRKHRSVGNGSREGRRLRKGLSGGWGCSQYWARRERPAQCSLTGLLEKKNEPLYLGETGQESSANVIKILSSPVRDTYRSSSTKHFFKKRKVNLTGGDCPFTPGKEAKAASCISQAVWAPQCPREPTSGHFSQEDILLYCQRVGCGSP